MNCRSHKKNPDVKRSHKKNPDVKRSHKKKLGVDGIPTMKKNTKRGLGFSHKRREHRRNETKPLHIRESTPQILDEPPAYIESIIQEQVQKHDEYTPDESEHETSEDEKETKTVDEIAEKIKIVDIFANASGVDHKDMITTCWCSGLRVHKSCAQELDLPRGMQLCLFDGGVNGVCTSDCISCVPCIVCHKIKDNDTHTSLSRDFPVGDNWLFREEKACPSCLATIRRGNDETHCEFCKAVYDENTVSM